MGWGGGGGCEKRREREGSEGGAELATKIQ